MDREYMSLFQPQQKTSSPSQQTQEQSCEYDCEGWPLQQCKVTWVSSDGSWLSASCLNPYTVTRGKVVRCDNYPECDSVPYPCHRCDDKCAAGDGRRDRSDYL